MNLLKFALKRALLSMNLEVKRIGDKPASLRRFADADPITFQYLSNLKIPAPVTLDLSQTRAGIMGFPHHPASAHPFARAFQAAKNETSKDARRTAIRDILSTYYSMVQPASALEVLDLQPNEAPGLVGIPLQSWVMPWTELSIEETAIRRRNSLEQEGIARGTFVTINDGATLFGPVSEKKIGLETARVETLAEQIRVHGFQPNSSSPVEVMGLRMGADYRWLAWQGQHRLAACAAFGILAVPAIVVRIIRREDVEAWPHVVTKTFTPGGALKCFDRLFAGNPPASALPWLALAGKPERPELEKASAG